MLNGIPRSCHLLVALLLSVGMETAVAFNPPLSSMLNRREAISDLVTKTLQYTGISQIPILTGRQTGEEEEESSVSG